MSAMSVRAACELFLWSALSLALEGRDRWRGKYGPVSKLSLSPTFPANAADILEPRFYRDLVVKQLLPFWSRHASDRRCGGFFEELDRQGVPRESADKSIAMQARMMYAFAADPLSGAEALEQGWSFIKRHMYDERYGGFFTRVSREGAVRDERKSLFGNAYAIIGLAGACRNTAEKEFLVCQLEHLLECAWDTRHGGFFDRITAAGAVDLTNKSICVQLDMLMALREVERRLDYRPKKPLAVTLLDLLMALGKAWGEAPMLGENHAPDWTYRPAPTRDRVQIGHSIKAAWLMMEFGQTYHRDDIVRFGLRLLDQSFAVGWDRAKGGLFQHIYRNGRHARAVKHWWSHCEAMPALLLAAKVSGDPAYRDRFVELMRFTLNHFVDVRYGEWILAVHADGSIHDDRKACATKSAYHTVQACLETAALLDGSKPAYIPI